MIDLDAIAAEETAKAKRAYPCWVCAYPNREWVERKKAEGLSFPVLTRTLQRAGHAEVTVHQIKGHFNRHV